MSKARLHITVSGKVQGVFYRDFTQKIAQSLGLTGWVRNTPDGSVEIIAEGEKEKLEEFLEKCKEGSDSSSVKDMKFEWSDATGEFETFSITH